VTPRSKQFSTQALGGKRCVVMGGSGFIGSHLCERLFAAGVERVVSVDNLLTGNAENLRSLRGRTGFEDVRHDVTEPFTVDGPVDFVFNLASPASPVDYHQLPLETLRAGALGTENGLRLAEAKRAIFFQASTSEVYGDPLVHPQREDYWGNVNPVGPRAVYDEAKRYGEALVSAWRRTRGVSVRIVRIFNTYGPRMRLRDGRVVPAFVTQALAGEDFTVFGDGKQTRSFCYVTDLVEGFLRLALSDVQEPVNLGNPEEMTILAFAEAVRTAAGGGGRILFQPLPTDDPKQRQPDIGRARALLGWEPSTGLEEGLRQTIAWFREHRAASPGHQGASSGAPRKATP
jgi:dTDP-glucose 4,6-dehydratase